MAPYDESTEAERQQPGLQRLPAQNPSNPPRSRSTRQFGSVEKPNADNGNVPTIVPPKGPAFPTTTTIAGPATGRLAVVGMVGRVVVIGLGPGRSVPAQARPPSRPSSGSPSAISASALPPSARALGAATAFDEVYEAATNLAEVYPAIVEELVGAAGAAGEILYAVPGSPFVAERTVELLRADGRVSVEIVPSLSFLDLAWGRLAVDPLAVGALAGGRAPLQRRGRRAPGPMLVGQCDTKLVLSEIKLSLPDGRVEITVLQRLGQSDELVSVVTGDDLDRVIEPDHLTCLWIPEPALPGSPASWCVGFDELVHTLRQQCPWDRAQTHASLRRHLLEETYEVLEAIDGLGPDGEGADHLEEELGDLLFQVYFHATLAEEEGLFTLGQMWPGGSTTSWCCAISMCSAPSRPTHPARS